MAQKKGVEGQGTKAQRRRGAEGQRGRAKSKAQPKAPLAEDAERIKGKHIYHREYRDHRARQEMAKAKARSKTKLKAFDHGEHGERQKAFTAEAQSSQRKASQRQVKGKSKAKNHSLAKIAKDAKKIKGKGI